MNCPTCSFENTSGATVCASCGTPLHAQNPDAITGAAEPYSPSLPSGTRLKGGAFAVGQVLGQGGFGITYKGGDTGLRRYVAIKEFFPHGSHRSGTTVAPQGTTSEDFASARQGFVREAMTLAKFSHPGIVRVFGVFEENNTAYMVMELLEGHSLQKRLDDKGVVPEKEAVSIVSQVGAALGAVHEARMLHRDIKPDNIVLTDDGRVVLIDFGTAREFAADKTRAMTAMVTHGYAPLEQYGKQAKFGAYTDVYALGATLYHCLTGRLPVSAMDRVAGVEMAPPERINPNLSAAVSQATMKALEVKAGDRFQSVADFVAALDAALKPVPKPAPEAPAAVPQSAPQVLEVAASGAETMPCKHCATPMPTWMGICPSCQKSKNAPIGSSDILPDEPPDTLFDRVMFAVPNWLWRVAGVAIVLGLTGRVGVAVVRYQNGGRDFGESLASAVMKSSTASPLQSASLHLGEGVYNPDTMRKTHDDYVGEVRYRDGDVGTIELDVKTRDWLYAPENFSFSFRPKDFGSLIGGQITREMDKKLDDGGSPFRVMSMGLARVSRTEYRGSYIIYVPKHPKLRDGGSVVATVETFHDDGTPATWVSSINTN